MARSASKGIFPRSGIVDGHIITHPNGKRYQWNSSKGVWKLKSTMIDDSNFIGPQGATGATGATGPQGPQGDNTLAQTQLGSGAHTLTNMVNPGDWSRVGGYQTMVRASGSNGLPEDHDQSYFGYMVTSRRDTGTGYSAILSAYDNSKHWITYNSTHDTYPEWLLINNPKFTGTGGTVTTSETHIIHTFTSSGTFTAIGDGAVDVLVIAGGGQGGGHACPGGGGAGGLIYKASINVSPGDHTVTIGAGGARKNLGSGSYPDANKGSDSSIFSLVAKGGGGGVVWDGGSDAGVSGGSSGGYGTGGSVNCGFKAATQPTQAGDSGTYGYGNAGGNGNYFSNPYPGGGGGGAGAAGESSPNGTTSGRGGIGKAYDISGASVYYAGGGQGGAWASVNRNTQPAGGGGHGDGGDGGGGGVSMRGYSGYSEGSAGAINKGSGGGGAGRNGGQASYGGAGGSGIVIIRYTS
jgi:hypothetical protein